MKKINNFIVKNRLTVYALSALLAGILCAVVICYLMFSNISKFGSFLNTLVGVLSPVIIGLVLAYIIDPIAKFFENHLFKKLKKEKLRRTFSALIALVLVLTFFGLFIGSVVPSLISSVYMLVDNVDTYYAEIQRFVDGVNSLGFGINIDLSSIVQSIKGSMVEFFGNITENIQSVLNTTMNIGNTLVNVVIGIILAIYFLFGKQFLVSGLTRLRKAMFTPETYERHNKFWRRCHEIFTQYIGCNVIDAMIIGISNAIFMIILGMPYAPLVSFTVGLTNLIPTFGPFIGAAIGALVLVLIKPSYALWFLLFTIGIQILDAYIIKPKLFSNSFGIPAVWTLIAITIGGKLFGVIGVLMAIPVAAIIAFIYDEKFIPWLQRRSKARAEAEKIEENGASVDGPETADEKSAEVIDR